MYWATLLERPHLSQKSLDEPLEYYNKLRTKEQQLEKVSKVSNVSGVSKAFLLLSPDTLDTSDTPDTLILSASAGHPL